MSATPFLKWVGGKRQLLDQLTPLLPKHINTYFEPFMGGAALYFKLARYERFDRAVLNDWNQDLVDTYRVIRDFPQELMAKLRQMESEYCGDPETYYYALRAEERNDNPVEWAARFIFLNKAGFNGLHRLNKAGKFNVPWSKKTQVTTFCQENIEAVHWALNGPTRLHHGDFVDAVATAQPGDVVYFDPPYLPEGANFTNYTKVGFSLDDHRRLAALFKDLFERGVVCILSNSDVPEIRALYQDFEIHEVKAKRNVNSKGDKRGPVSELIIVGRRPAIQPTAFSV